MLIITCSSLTHSGCIYLANYTIYRLLLIITATAAIELSSHFPSFLNFLIIAYHFVLKSTLDFLSSRTKMVKMTSVLHIAIFHDFPTTLLKTTFAETLTSSCLEFRKGLCLLIASASSVFGPSVSDTSLSLFSKT